ncbi:MAG: ketosteroid isomerase-like protein [Paracoccaceae bacterium]|jgi:ketosteroid isomerase-like protein
MLDKDAEILKLGALEERRYAAMLAGDAEVLEELLHPDLAYMHSTGELESKQSYLDTLRAGTSSYKAIRYDQQTIRIHDNTGLVFHHLEADVVFEGIERHLDNRLLAVWVCDEGHWRMLALQSGPVPR